MEKESLSEYKKHFEEHGFVLLKDFLSDKDSKFVANSADELEKWKETPNEWMIFHENNGNTKFRSRMENFINYNIKFKQYLNDNINAILEYITEKEMYLFKDKLNWKMGGGKGFLAHQDQPAWTDFKPDRFYTVALFANDSTIEKGCLQFVKNGFNKELYDYEKEGTGKLQNEEQFEWEYVPTTPRDVLIFDSYVPHRSFENKTEDPRRIFYFTYNSKEYGDLYNKYLVKKRIEFPPDIERDKDKTYNVFNNKYNLANPIR
jgi:2-aminoethylphosphonate dioxygenase